MHVTNYYNHERGLYPDVPVKIYNKCVASYLVFYTQATHDCPLTLKSFEDTFVVLYYTCILLLLRIIIILQLRFSRSRSGCNGNGMRLFVRVKFACGVIPRPSINENIKDIRISMSGKTCSLMGEELRQIYEICKKIRSAHIIDQSFHRVLVQ